MLWKNDKELFEFCKTELFTAVVGDVMDKMSYTHQFLPPQIKPLISEMVVIGRAMPVLEADCFEETSPTSRNSVMHKPFGLMMEALDDLKPGEVYICTGSTPTYALWGELMSSRAMKLGAAGAVVNGYSRDTNGIIKLNFPTFSFGGYAQDQGCRGKVIDWRCPIKMGCTRINPGDIVFGDIDGVCVVPREIEKEVFTTALKKARTENKVRKAIQNGMSATEAFGIFGVM
jgi:regulator of RNase E activity RraA